MTNKFGGGANSLLERRFLLFKKEGADKEMSTWETVREFSEIGTDTNNLSILFENPKGYREIYFVFFGRENNVDDSLSNGNGNDNITINNVRSIVKPLVYIRGKDNYFYTYGQIKLVNDFILGQVARDDGQGGTSIMTISPLQAKTIDNISIISNALLKADSKLAVYAK